MHAMKNLVAILQNALDLRQVTVKQLADEVGCSRQHVYNILEGVQAPTLPLAEKLAKAVGAEMTVKKISKKRAAS